jgi:hypothetical protein
MAQLTTLYSGPAVKLQVHNPAAYAVLGVAKDIVIPSMSLVARDTNNNASPLVPGTLDTFHGVAVNPVEGTAIDGEAKAELYKDVELLLPSVAGSPAIDADVYCTTNNPKDVTTANTAPGVRVGRITSITSLGTVVRFVSADQRDPGQA